VKEHPITIRSKMFDGAAIGSLFLVGSWVFGEKHFPMPTYCTMYGYVIYNFLKLYVLR